MAIPIVDPLPMAPPVDIIETQNKLNEVIGVLNLHTELLEIIRLALIQLDLCFFQNAGNNNLVIPAALTALNVAVEDYKTRS